MTSTTISILLNQPFESIFQNVCPENFMTFKGLANTTKDPELFCPFAPEVLGLFLKKYSPKS